MMISHSNLQKCKPFTIRKTVKRDFIPLRYAINQQDDTLIDYYESIMRDFKTYGCGRTLKQSFEWIISFEFSFANPNKIRYLCV